MSDKEQPRHTPEPWDVVPWFDGKAIIVVKGDDGGVRLVIARVEDVPGSPDANLLKAAPKLLAALKASGAPLDGVYRRIDTGEAVKPSRRSR